MAKFFLAIVIAPFMMLLGYSGDSTVVTVTFTVTPLIKLEIDASDLLSAQKNPIPITVKLRISSSSKATLTVEPSGAEFVNHIAWRAVGDGFVDGRLNSAMPQEIGLWIGPGKHTGFISFFVDDAQTLQKNTNMRIKFRLTVSGPTPMYQELELPFSLQFP